MVAPALAGVEGKVQDRTGKPLSGLKVASQETAVKGYEKFESAVGQDGAFKFEKLLPESKYVLKPQSDAWATDVAVPVTTGRQGEIFKITSPINIRFTVSKDSVIGDLATGLEWHEGPDRDTTWDQASAWVNSLNVAGGGWRMPTTSELGTLYQKGSGERNMPKAFKTKGWGVWSGQLRDSSAAWYFYFNGGQEYWGYRNASYYTRAFAVRSRK
jgi:hypothetical protein